jgi:hypothetical protein
VPLVPLSMQYGKRKPSPLASHGLFNRALDRVRLHANCGGRAA